MDNSKKDLPELPAIHQKEKSEALRASIIETEFKAIKAQSRAFGAGACLPEDLEVGVFLNNNDGAIDQLHVVRPDYRIEKVAALIDSRECEKQGQDYIAAALALDKLYRKGALKYGTSSRTETTPGCEIDAIEIHKIPDEARCRTIHLPALDSSFNQVDDHAKPVGTYIVQFDDEDINRSIFQETQEHSRINAIEVIKEEIRAARARSVTRKRSMKM